MLRPLTSRFGWSCQKFFLIVVTFLCTSSKCLSLTITTPGYQPCTTSETLSTTPVPLEDGPSHDPVSSGDYAIYPENGFPDDLEQVETDLCGESEKVLPYEDMEITDIIRLEGYAVNEIKVTTEDGYILTIHRIHASPLSPESSRKTPVLLWHGLFGNAMSWLFLGNQSLAYKLADSGYDVFLGNSRGNNYSQEHEDVNDDSDAFWNFSFHEIGFYDIPNTIDKILEITGARDLYYVGYSLGTAAYTVATALRPHMATKIKTAFLLTPASHISQMTQEGLLSLIKADWKGVGTKFDSKKMFSLLGNASCTLESDPCDTDCEYLVNLAFGKITQSDPSIIKFFAKRYLGTTSTKVLQHLSQMYKNKDFRRFDWESVEENRKHYGEDKPPLYDLRNVTTPTVFFWGYGDDVISPEDVKKTATLFNKDALKENNRVMSENFSHLDFIVGDNVQQLVYERLIWLMKSNRYVREIEEPKPLAQ